MKKVNVVIIGAGAVGTAIAYEFGRKKVKDVLVIEKNSKIPGLNQSSRNGGIIHSGIYYPQSVEPLKAKLCVDGSSLMYSFCKTNNIPHKKTGKLILAVNKNEEAYLTFFYNIGLENGIKGLRLIDGEKARKMEKALSSNVSLAIYVPNCGSVALEPFVSKLYTLALRSSVSFMTSSIVTDIKPTDKGFVVTVKKGKKIEIIECNTLINAAGLYADEIAKLVNPNSTYEIEGTRGELASFSYNKRPKEQTSHMHLYPAPFCYYNDTKEVANVSPTKLLSLLKQGKITKTLGAHVSPVFVKDKKSWSITKTVGVGPIKNIGYGKDDYETNMHPISVYAKRVSTYFPHINEKNLKIRFSGIMAVLKGHTDFVIEQDTKFPRCINLVGMDSPAFTASLAIAKYTHEMYKKRLQHLVV